MKPRMRSTLVVILLILTIPVACQGDKTAAERAAAYIQSYGYEIVEIEEELSNSYTLTQSMLRSRPYLIRWALFQVRRPTRYIDREIHTESFIVKDHPLLDITIPRYGYDWHAHSFPTQVRIVVHLYDNKPIGGLAYPLDDQGKRIGNSPDPVSLLFSIEGKTLYEVYGIQGPSEYQDWLRTWQKQFR